MLLNYILWGIAIHCLIGLLLFKLILRAVKDIKDNSDKLIYSYMNIRMMATIIALIPVYNIMTAYTGFKLYLTRRAVTKLLNKLASKMSTPEARKAVQEAINKWKEDTKLD